MHECSISSAMHENERGEWDLHWRFLVGNTVEIAGCFDAISCRVCLDYRVRDEDPDERHLGTL